MMLLVRWDESAKIDGRDFAAGEEGHRPVDRHRDAERSREVVGCAEGQDAEHSLGVCDVIRDRAGRAVATGGDHEPGIGPGAGDAVSKLRQMLDRQLSTNRQPLLGQGRAGSRDLTRAAGVGAADQHNLSRQQRNHRSPLAHGFPVRPSIPRPAAGGFARF